jgi:myo-inositol-1(or 4)-monophosphatase
MEWNEVRRIALLAARGAAELHLQHVGRVRPDQWGSKGNSDFVTYVDREAEQHIVQCIHTAFPAHHIMAEEAFADDPQAAHAHWAQREWVWIIDPLDGTTNFLHGYPVYSASVAAAHRGRLVAGAVVSGPTAECWSAALGQGAERNGSAVCVSGIDRLQTALIGTGFPFKNLSLLPGYLQQFDAVMRHTSGVRRAGSAALDLCHVASGQLDGFWELELNPWDFAAGVLLIQEAGGVSSGLEGVLDPFDRGSVLAGNPLIHAALRNLLHGVS